jgi:Zn-finger nucleic acid-binding protein
MRATIIAAVVVLAFSVNNAFAVSLAVKLACKDDYFAHCSMHSPGSPGVRKCMRAVGRNLSPRCIGALADAGEIKKSVKTKYYAKQQNAQRKLVQKSVSKKQYAQKNAAKRKYAAKAIDRRKAARKEAAYRELLKRKNERKNYTRLAADH